MLPGKARHSGNVEEADGRQECGVALPADSEAGVQQMLQDSKPSGQVPYETLIVLHFFLISSRP